MIEKITRLVKLAAMATAGVSRMSSPIEVLVIPKQLKLETYDVDVFLIVKADVRIPEVAWDVQNNIMRVLKAEGINSVEHININVQGVDY